MLQDSLFLGRPRRGGYLAWPSLPWWPPAPLWMTYNQIEFSMDQKRSIFRLKGGYAAYGSEKKHIPTKRRICWSENQKRSIFRLKRGYAAYGSEKYHRVMDGGLKCQLIAFLLKSLQNKRLCQKKALIYVLQYTAKLIHSGIDQLTDALFSTHPSAISSAVKPRGWSAICCRTWIWDTLGSIRKNNIECWTIVPVLPFPKYCAVGHRCGSHYFPPARRKRPNIEPSTFVPFLPQQENSPRNK